MGRYTGKAVTERNGFVSQESNTIDPNSDKNPLLDNNDPTKGNGPDRTHGDDFEVVGEDLVELKKTTESDVTEEGEVLNKITEIDNIAKEGQDNASAIEALAAVSTEMRAVLADKGFLSAGEFMAVRGLIASCEAAVPNLRTVETAMPSMEDFKIPGLEYSNANVSMESIGEKIDTAFNNLKLNLQRLFKNGVGLANSLTPLYNKQLARAQSLRNGLNSAHRDDGQKTVSGKFIQKLAIEGRAPDASTVLKTAKYLSEISDNIITHQATEMASAHLKNALKFVDSGVDFTKLEKPSMWLMFIIWIAKGASFIDHPIANVVTKIGETAENEVNRRVFDKLRVSGEMAPELFNVFSTVAKVNHPSESKNLDARKSLPLFGDVEIVVTQYAKEVNMTLGHVTVPSLYLEHPKGWGKRTKANDMQSLTSQQQKEVLDSAIKVLENGRDYFKEYANRNGKCMEAYQRAHQMKQNARKESKTNGFGGADRYILPVYNFYTKLYWRGIFADQSKIANYTRVSAKALIDLVAASSEAAQGGESVSTEAFNDFM